MTELFQQLLAWVAQHPYWAGILIFSVAMAESLAIVGMVVPGVVIMFGIGALIAAGSIDFWAAMAWAVAGAIVGDGASFWFGRRYSDRLTGIWPFSRHPESLTRGIAFFERYGGKSVAAGRFFGPVRAVIPLVAGMMGMPPVRFALANIVSALVWAPAYLLPGMIFGASLELASEVAFRLVILILVLAISVWLIVWLIHRVFLQLQPYSTQMVQGILRWGYRHPYLQGISAALADPTHPEARGLSILATVLILAFALFSIVTGWGLRANPGTGINHMVLDSLQSLRTPWADQLMVLISSLAEPESMAVICIGMALLLLLRGRRHALVYWIAAAGFALLTGPLLTYVLQPPRPGILPIQARSITVLSSDHTLWATVIYGFASVMVARSSPPRLRWLPYSTAGLLIGFVAFSRLYLGVNWLSDVLDGFALGMIWVSALGIAYSRHTRPEPDLLPLVLTIALGIGSSLALHSLLLHHHKLDAYRPLVQTDVMMTADWWDKGWSRLPGERLDTRNRRDHPLSIQYAGPLPALTAALEGAGWHVAPRLAWGNLLKLLSPSLGLQELPVLPQVHDGEHEALVLEKQLPEDRRLVLRLWPANITLTPERTPLWIGLVAEQHKVEILGLLAFAATSMIEPPLLAQLTGDLEETLRYRLTQDSRVLITEQRNDMGSG